MELYNLEQNVKKRNTSEQQTSHLLIFNSSHSLPNLSSIFPRVWAEMPDSKIFNLAWEPPLDVGNTDFKDVWHNKTLQKFLPDLIVFPF